MIRKIASFLCLLIAALPAAAQFTTVTGSNVDAGNQPAGIVWTLCFAPTGVPGKGFQVGGVGQISGQPICRDVEGDVILTTLRGTVIGPMMVADTSLSSPANVCYVVTLRDDNGNIILGGNAPYSGYGCVQPSGGTWSFDTYVPSEPAIALGQSIADLSVENLTVTNCFGTGCSSGGIVLETNGTHNSLQSLLNFQNGTGTTASNPSGGIEQINVTYGTTSSTAAQGNDSRIVGAEQVAHKGVANGYAELDAGALLPHNELPVLLSADIPNNAASTTGSAASLSAASALPNGTTASTQTGGDNTTKVATDAFVQSALPTSLPPNGSAGGKLSGTYPNPGVNLASGDIPNNAANTTGSAASLNAASALPNGTTGTTQTSTDNTTKLATDAFVQTLIAGISIGVTSVDGRTGAVTIISADIPNNAANTTGSAGSLSAASALPNGTTGTTQTSTDNTNKIATDAFVQSALPTSLPPNGSAGGKLSGTYPNPGVNLASGDIPNNAANTTGSAASLSAASALPNGTTAATQNPGDNSTKVATTAFVLANAGAPASGTPITAGNRYFNVSSPGVSNYSVWTRMAGDQLTYLAPSWKVVFGFFGGTGVSINKAVVLRTARQALTVIDSTTIKFSGSSSYVSAFSGASISAPFIVTSDAISLALDTQHDYYIMLYFNNDGTGYNAALVTGSSSGASAPSLWLAYASGDQTGSSSVTEPSSINQGVILSVVTP